MEKTNFREIKKYVQLVESSNISELEITEEGVTLRIKKELQVAPAQVTQFTAPAPPAPQTQPTALEYKPVTPPPEIKKVSFQEVKSPMVGTFYHAPSPEAEAYVQVGDKVKQGQVLCIIEAMKLMNEIESDFAGTMVEICVENAKPVEFEQVLFRIEKV